MRNLYLERAKSTLRRWIQLEKNPAKRAELQGILDDINSGIMTYEKWIQDAKMIGLRNPSFDGDEVGYPEDDFDK